MLHPLFLALLALTGTIPACHLSTQKVRPFPSPSAPGDRPIRASDRQIRAVEIARSEISPRFLRHGRSHRLRTIGGNGKLFGRPGGKVIGETLGGGGGGVVVGEGMFHEGAGGSWGMEREIIGL